MKIGERFTYKFYEINSSKQCDFEFEDHAIL